MTVKYVPADTSSLEKPERLVPDTDFMTPIRENLCQSTSTLNCNFIQVSCRI